MRHYYVRITGPLRNGFNFNVINTLYRIAYTIDCPKTASTYIKTLYDVNKLRNEIMSQLRNSVETVFGSNPNVI